MTSATRRSATPARRRSTAACASTAEASVTTSSRCGSSSVLERDGAGLNLTGEVRDGILHHTGAGSRPRWRARSSAWSTASPTSTTTSTTRCGPGSSTRRAAAGRSGCSATARRGGSTRSSTTWSRHRERRRHRPVAGPRRRAARSCARSCSSTSTWAGRARTENARARPRWSTALFEHFVDHPTSWPRRGRRVRRHRLGGRHDRPLRAAGAARARA